jgi:hypothetical protein
MIVTNTLAYFAGPSFRVFKFYIDGISYWQELGLMYLGPGANVIKHFTVVSYEFS